MNAYSLLDVEVEVVEVAQVAVDVDDRLDQPVDVVPVVDEVHPGLVQLDEPDSLKVQRVVTQEVQGQEEVRERSQQDVPDWFLLVRLQPVNDCLDQGKRLSEPEHLPRQRHVRLHLLQSLLSVSVGGTLRSDEGHDELDEVLHKSASLRQIIQIER